MSRLVRLAAILIVGAAIAPASFTTAGASGTKCKKFQSGMTIADCPKEGCGNETNLNLAKNRTDSATNPTSMSVADIVALDAKIDRAWSGNVDRDPIRVAGEGKAVVVEGYLLDAREQGAEDCNCKWGQFRDTRIRIVPTPNDAQSKAIVAEISPRLDVDYLDAEKLQALVAAAKKAGRPLPHVRVTGWLMLDTHDAHEHPKDRATSWEVHPVTAFRVLP